MVWLFLLLLGSLQVILIGTVILLENRDPGKTVAWLCILGIFPFLGFILYVVFGRKTQGPLFRNKHIPDNRCDITVRQQKTDFNAGNVFPQLNTDSEQKLASLLLNSGFAPMTIHNQVEILLNGGEKFKELFNALEGASDHIHLSYFIFKDDEIGEDVLKILARKVVEGVEVRVLLDGMGSISISGGFIRSMRKAGIQAEWFFPIRFPYITSRLNLRYHRKIVVVDGRTGFMGGLNIGDEYLSRDAKLGFWRDTHLKLEGEAVHTLQSIFLNDWYYVTHQEVQGARYFPQTTIFQVLPVQIVGGGPDSNWRSILQSFFKALTMAKNSVSIETPYFIPDESLMMALKTAALSGLDVRLVVQGTPEHNLTFLAMHSYFEELLQAGVRIYKYMKGTLHAKIFLIDNQLASVGSANMDLRSFLLDFEICAFAYDRALVERLKLDFEQDLNESIELVLKTFQARPVFERFKESSARLFSPVL
ncbi:MAG: cardiolipin synthase [Desulfosporosinus sp. BRH_c37]|nr:MAG: cardiolipin synthase [Desulfosporosinus sp. BRH_c37]